MIRILNGDLFDDNLKNEITKCINEPHIGDKGIEFPKSESTLYLSSFLEKRISCLESPFYYNTKIKNDILILNCAEYEDNKNIVLLNPISELHIYYTIKYVDWIVQLHNKKKHNFVIVTNDCNFIDQFRVNVAKKILDYKDIIIEFYWNNEMMKIELNKNGFYKMLPQYYDDIHIDQLSKLIGVDNYKNKEKVSE